MRPKCITQMDQNEKILEGFFTKHVYAKCDKCQKDELGVLLLGQETYDKVKQEASEKHKNIIKLMFAKWITRRGRDANYETLSDAFKKMERKDLYDRLYLYYKEERRLYCTE